MIANFFVKLIFEEQRSKVKTHINFTYLYLMD